MSSNKFLVALVALVALSAPAFASNAGGGAQVSTVQNLDGTITAITAAGIVTVSRPAITGDVTIGTSSNAATVAKIQGTTVSGTTGSGNVAFSTSPVFTTPNIGNATGSITGNAATVTTNANMSGVVTSVGNATSFGPFTSATLAAAITDKTGTGSAVFGTSPALVTPNLGTPSAINLSNATGLPLGTATTGLLNVSQGGTGNSTNTNHGVLIGEGTSALQAVSPIGTSGIALVSVGTSSNPVFGALNLGTSGAVTGTLPVANGGTAFTSMQAGLGNAEAISQIRQNLANVAVGSSSPMWMFIGDSETEGYGATSQNQTNSFSQDMARAINNHYGIPTNWQNFFGYYQATRDTRVTIGSGWGTSGAYGIGGPYIFASSATSSLSFTPDMPVDTFKYCYVTNTGLGTFSANIDGGSNTNTSTNTTAGFACSTLTSTSPGKHTININWVSGASGVYIGGVIASNSTQPALVMLNGGWYGVQASQYANNSAPYNPLPAIQSLAPNLCFIKLGANDWMNSISLSTFSTSLQSLITGCQASGAVIMSVDSGSNTATVSDSVQETYVSAIQSLATTNNLVFMDNFNRAKLLVPSASSAFSALQTLGWINTDYIHPTAQGYADEAAFYLSGIMPIQYTNGIGSNSISTPLFVNGNVGIGTVTPQATLDVSGAIRTSCYAIASLPSGVQGMRACVNNQLTTCAVPGAALTAGGSVVCPVFYNGSAWVGD